MTSSEKLALDQLVDFVRDWRREDTEWKNRAEDRQSRHEQRLREVEMQLANARAVSAGDADRALSTRARMALVISALGASGGLLLGVFNAIK